MSAGSIFQVVDLGEFDSRGKKSFRFKPISPGRKLTGAFLYSPENERWPDPAYANLRLCINNKSQCILNYDYALQIDDPGDTTPRYRFRLNSDIKPGQLMQGYVTLLSATHTIHIKLYLIYQG